MSTERDEFNAYWLARQRAAGFGEYLSDAEMLSHPERYDDEFHAYQAGKQAALSRSSASGAGTAADAGAPEGWRKVLADLRLGLAAGSRSMSNSDFEIEYGGALLDAVAEKLEVLAAAERSALQIACDYLQEVGYGVVANEFRELAARSVLSGSPAPEVAPVPVEAEQHTNRKQQTMNLTALLIARSDMHRGLFTVENDDRDEISLNDVWRLLKPLNAAIDALAAAPSDALATQEMTARVLDAAELSPGQKAALALQQKRVATLPKDTYLIDGLARAKDSE